jgi:hypothetical protein
MKARLYPNESGDRYSVLFHGEIIVERSRDPECDTARALLARGYTGKLTMLDGKTGKPCTYIDIEKAAKLTARENSVRGPHFAKWKPFEPENVLARTAESDEAGTVIAPDTPEAVAA